MSLTYRIGTSGWNYKHWQGAFYPAELSQSKWLEFYCQHFDTVELNASFYRLPQQKTFESWRDRTPRGFCWAVKASRIITHRQRLRDVGTSIERFYSHASCLREKLGPVLFQLPPSLTYDAELFEDFCYHLEPIPKSVVEIRHRSWLNERFFSQLEQHGIAFCISDTAGRFPYHEAITARFVYIRLHGSKKLYASEYSEEELTLWAQKIIQWQLPAYVYFDNDFNAYAVKNAIQLKKILHALDYRSL